MYSIRVQIFGRIRKLKIIPLCDEKENFLVNLINKYIKEKYNVYKLFIDKCGETWYTIYRVKGEENLNGNKLRVATLQQIGVNYYEY